MSKQFRPRFQLEHLESRDVPSAPASPEQLFARPVIDTAVNLTWALGDNTDTSIIIERQTGSTGVYQTLAVLPGGENTYTDTNCWAATTYTYRIKSHNADGDSGYSNAQTTTTNAIPVGGLATVTDLRATATSSTTTSIAFTDPNTSNSYRYYTLERSADGIVYQAVASLGLATSWQDSGLTPGVTYSYRVRAGSYTVATSDYSAPAAVTMPALSAGVPAAPSGLQATDDSATAVTLTWSNTDPAAQQFQIERAVYNPWNPMVWSQVGVTPAGTTAFTDTGLTAEQAYAYRVRAVNGTAVSAYATPASDVMRSIFGTGVGVVTASAGTGSPKTYDIGPGYAMQNIADLNWSTLGPGDTVNIHYRPGGYHELFQISTRGTPAAWITINGVPDPATGALPVIDGDQAVLAPQFVNHYTALSGAGGVVVGSRPGYVAGYKPGYITIENLQVQNVYQGNSINTFTDYDGSTKTYGAVGAGIYLERADHVTIKECVIAGNGEGVFGAGQSGFDRLMTNITLDGNHIYGNGNVASHDEHNSYIEGIDTVYQYNVYGPVRSGSAGAGLKDRSVGLVIRYNYIEGGAHQLQLPESENQMDLAVTLPEFHQTFVYGNVLVAPPGDGASIIFFGGDVGLTPYYRKGTLYLYNNTLVANSDRSSVYNMDAVQLTTSGETLDARNNIFASIPSTVGVLSADLGLLGPDNSAYLGRNWVTPRYFLTTSSGYKFTGYAAGLTNLMVGTSVDPGFVNLVGGDYRLAAGSAVIDAAGRLPGSTQPYPVNEQFWAQGVRQDRPVVGAAPDLGAFEYGAPPPNAGQVQFATNTYTASESSGGVTITVQRVGGSIGTVSVQYATANGTAVAGTDYQAVSGTLTWLDGDMAPKTIFVPISSDSVIEGNETVVLQLSNPTGGATLGLTGQSLLTITDSTPLSPPPPPPPANTPPVVAATPNQNTTVGKPVNVAVRVSDAETATTDLIVTVSSSNSALLPPSAITLAGAGPNRTLTLSPLAGVTGSAIVTVTVRDAGGLTASTRFTLTVNEVPTSPPPVSPLPPADPTSPTSGSDSGSPSTETRDPTTHELVSQPGGSSSPLMVGGANGTAGVVNLDGSVRFSTSPFPGFTGEVRVASADFNGDGVTDLVVGTGPGSATHVRVLDGKDGRELLALDPFESSFTGGVFVAAGDINGDGVPDLIVTPDQGGGPRVRVFSGKDFSPLADFFGIDDPNFRGGARATVGDLNGDGAADLVIAAGFGGGPRVAAFTGQSVTAGDPTRLFADFFVFEPGLRNGVYVAAGDLNGDGDADLIFGGGPGGGPRVLALSGRDLLAGQQVQVANFFAGDVSNRGGVRVAVKNLDGDGRTDLITGAGSGGGSRVTTYAGKDITAGSTPTELSEFDAFPGVAGGVYVG